VDHRYVRTIDATATLLDLAGVSASIDGRSLRDPGYRGQSQISVRKQEGGAVTISPAAWQSRAARVHERRVALFGTGHDSLFAFGPRKDLHGRAVVDYDRLRRSKLRATVLNARRFTHVRGSFLPAHVIGRLRGPRPGGRVVAVALNDVIVATAPTYPPLGKIRFGFSAMLPPDAFVKGRNRLEVFEVVGDRLRPL
jgi:hypothetical protein